MLRPPGLAGAEPPSRRLRLGGFDLDLDARELLRPGARRGKRLTAKAQQVLVELALRPGEVLSRDALMDAVWPDSYPTGDVLTQAIVQLRRAFDDDVEAPRYIETIAKSGYRLLAEVIWLPPPEAKTIALAASVPLPEAAASVTAEAVTVDASPRSADAGSRRAQIGVGAALLLGLLTLAVWLLRAPLPGPDARVPAARLLTSQPGDERSPVPAPDGSQFVYAGVGAVPAGAGQLSRAATDLAARRPARRRAGMVAGRALDRLPPRRRHGRAAAV
jgi:DNA-binding winged helix-turn-helix (wHTH) protein